MEVWQTSNLRSLRLPVDEEKNERKKEEEERRNHRRKIQWWRGGAASKAFGLAISRSRVGILLEATLRNNLRQVVYTYVPLSPSSICLLYTSDAADE